MLDLLGHGRRWQCLGLLRVPPQRSASVWSPEVFSFVCLSFLNGKTKSSDPFFEALPRLAESLLVSLSGTVASSLSLLPCGYSWHHIWFHQRATWGFYPTLLGSLSGLSCYLTSLRAQPHLCSSSPWDPQSLVEPVCMVSFSCQCDTVSCQHLRRKSQ